MQPDRWDPPAPHHGGGGPGGAGPSGRGLVEPTPIRGRRAGGGGPAWNPAWDAPDEAPTGPIRMPDGGARAARGDAPGEPADALGVDDPADGGYETHDEYGEYDDYGGVDDEPPRRRGSGGGRRGRGRRSAVLLAAVLLLLGGLAGGGYYVYSSYFSTPDFTGDGAGDVIIEVQSGDSTTQIGRELQERGVVASVEAFTDAASDESRIRSVQPGFYQLRAEMSGRAAVARLLDPVARVGQLEIRGGVQLDDTSAPDGTVAPGVLSLISKASCTTVDGAERCVSVDDLRAAMATTDPATLGVPEWALEDVARADPNRRLEGLLVPGRYNVLPSTSPQEVLQDLLAASASKLEATGLVSGAQAISSTPYQVLTIASLVEKEAITPDMPKVARVVYNRLGAGQRLELDSMVNYPLDLQALRTTPEDRARPGPYNSYLVTGLPPTPISAPGPEAIAAALAPEQGPWFFFVRCQNDGVSCFATTFDEHQQNVVLARQNGAF
ncbi:endolytic transglycosylase MltG [Pseudonocardia humida]|uniref:Endolytic murein transglycosylase n=1 Tax=Pseudonocardia humida TaxID=2800819 RepID=A0ABT1A6V2_9PSEU|nr:endolytic transglycosylase MltG [Pseudonocardia humida]MCO1658752.1 endolytic transglycosylase MltG [Pseudonocardia humida]